MDDAFARWDRARLHEFTLADSQRIGRPDPEFDTAEVLDDPRITLGRLRASEQFVHVFHFGDDLTHLCTFGDRRVDPLETLGILPEACCPTSAGPAAEDSDGALRMVLGAHVPLEQARVGTGLAPS
jgi:hypothetical protein